MPSDDVPGAALAARDAVGMRNGLVRVVAEPNPMMTAVQTVGQKGWGGFSISIVGG